jgi:hypothetical protein
MIRKSGYRFSDKIMLHRENESAIASVEAIALEAAVALLQV